MVDFNEVINDIQASVNVGSTMIPGGNLLFGSHATQNQGQILGVLGTNASSMFSGVTGAVGGGLSSLMNSPMLYIAGGVALLILIK